jgi:hypothetical protein
MQVEGKRLASAPTSDLRPRKGMSHKAVAAATGSNVQACAMRDQVRCDLRRD